MKKLILAIITIVTFVTVTPFQNSWAVGLKKNSVITGDKIKLGDIFYDLPRNEEYILGSAPNPGEEMVLNARTLLRIAMAMDLQWRPSGVSDSITLHRKATIIEYEQIEKAIYAALQEKIIGGDDYEIKIPSNYRKIVLPHDMPAQIVVTKLTTDTKRKSFKATIVAPSAENPVQHLRIKGQIYPVITVPVLSGNIQYGSIITKDDIAYTKIKEHEFSRDIIVDAQKLVGMTARKMIISGRPIKETDVIAPQIVKRGSLVTLSLNSGAMNLTTQVKALENGAKGDVIRVVNTLSNKTLQATVISDGEVAILQN